MKLITATIVAMMFYCAGAQIRSDTLYTGNIFLRFNALNLADVSEPNISFGAERRVAELFSVALDAGYIFYSQTFNRTGRSRGFIIRPAVRYFPGNGLFYLETELHYKQTTHHLHDWVGRDVVENVPSYEQFTLFRLRKRVIGTHFKVGRMVPVSNKLWFEFYLGGGVHFRKYFVVGDPDFTFQFTQNMSTITTGETDILIAVPGGFRLLYRI